MYEARTTYTPTSKVMEAAGGGGRGPNWGAIWDALTAARMARQQPALGPTIPVSPDHPGVVERHAKPQLKSYRWQSGRPRTLDYYSKMGLGGPERDLDFMRMTPSEAAFLVRAGLPGRS